jgi:hypothetical protein
MNLTKIKGGKDKEMSKIEKAKKFCQVLPSYNWNKGKTCGNTK